MSKLILVIYMSRIERKKAEQKKANRLGMKMFCIFIVLVILILGINEVDNAFRFMMLIEEPKVFGHQKLSDGLHQIYFCGEKFLINEDDIREIYGTIKNEVQVFLRLIKERKDQLVQKY